MYKNKIIEWLVFYSAALLIFVAVFIFSTYITFDKFDAINLTELLTSKQLFLHFSITILVIVVFLYWRRHGFSLKELHLAKMEIEQERSQAKNTLAAMSDAVIVVNNQGLVQFLNPSTEVLIDYKNEDASGRHLNEILILFKDNQEEKLNSYDFLSDFLFQDKALNLKLNTADSKVIVAVKVSQLAYSNPAEGSNPADGSNPAKGSGLVIVLRDVSTEHQLTDKLTYQVNHDSLTGLYNRVAFEHQLEIMLGYTQINKNIHCALYLDLDRFKLVNDTGGHAAGDKLLTVISGLLAAQLREHDFLARLGGDEFGILLWNMSYDTSVDVAQRILASVQEFRFEWEGKGFDIGVSIGLAMIDTDMKSLQDIMLAIDLACLQAKDSGRNTIFVYEKDNLSLNRQKEEMNWLPKINKALKTDQFVLYFQSIEPTTKQSCLPRLREILVRMLDQDGNILSPALFIPPAERYGVMKKIDCWVIKHTIEHLSRHKDNGFRGRYTINLSGQSLTDPSLPDYVESLFLKYDLLPDNLCFEITETAAIDNLNVAKAFVERMHTIGCGILLDDFGSGFSSFAYLKALPFDYIKIDGQFVNNITDDAIDETMVRMIHEIAQVMKVQTIAEYVEDEQTLRHLGNIGIDYVQGFLIAKPVPLE